MKPLPSSPNDPSTADDGVSAPLSDREIETHIGSIQGDLRGYIISLSGHSDDCDDILQESNIFLWERRTDFQPGTSFKAWAFKVAYFKSMASRRDRVRRGEVVFSEDISQRISAEAGLHFGTRPDKISALRRCLGKLTTDELRLIKVKYQQQKSLSSFALQTGKSVDAIHKSISRVRLALRSCVENVLSSNSN